MAATVVGCVVAACTMSGCVSNAPGTKAMSADEAFEAGSDRPPTPKTLYTMSRILAAQGRDNECRFVLERVIREEPGFIPAYCELSELHMRRNHLTEAVAVLNAGLAKSPDDAVLTNNLGMCALMRGENQEGLDHFTRAAALAPDNARFRANMGTALGMMGRYDEAQAVFEQVVTTRDAHFNVGVLCEARDDHARAEVEFTLAKQAESGEEPAEAAAKKPKGAAK